MSKLFVSIEIHGHTFASVSVKYDDRSCCPKVWNGDDGDAVDVIPGGFVGVSAHENVGNGIED